MRELNVFLIKIGLCLATTWLDAGLPLFSSLLKPWQLSAQVNAPQISETPTYKSIEELLRRKVRCMQLERLESSRKTFGSMLECLRHGECLTQVAYLQEATDMLDDFLREALHVVIRRRWCRCQGD